MGHVSVRPEDVDLVLYHASCWDGAGAAWAAHRVLGERAEYRACHHASRLPPVRGKTVALLDIAFDARTMQHIQLHSKDFVVLDHHVSAEKALGVIDERHKVFDSSQSGAALAWQFFHPGRPVPDALLYVEDRDIWNWRLPGSEAFNAAIMNSRPTFEMFEALHGEGAGGVARLIREGAPLHDYASRVHANIARHAAVRTLGRTGHRVAVVNSIYFKSEIGNLLAEREDADLGMVFHWCMKKQAFLCSLRVGGGAGDTVDATEVAGLFGGGGHEKAAAFRFNGSSIEELFAPDEGRPRQGKQGSASVAGSAEPAALSEAAAGSPLLRRFRAQPGSGLV